MTLTLTLLLQLFRRLVTVLLCLDCCLLLENEYNIKLWLRHLEKFARSI